jgi:dolichol-phosphate mannosyltransferase
MSAPTLAAVVPAYRVASQVTQVVEGLLAYVQLVFVVDDACPEGSGAAVTKAGFDARVQVLRHAHNRGVGAAVVTGWKAALAAGATVVVKVDGDGQMRLIDLPRLVAPVLAGEADYAKGNRFDEIATLKAMPLLRLLGNSALSFMAKASTGYWHLFDPTNGYVAIDARLLSVLLKYPLAERYFFETDVLFRLGTLRAVVEDISMPAQYGEQSSSLRPLSMVVPFLFGHLRNGCKRLFYTYFLRGMSIASVQLTVGWALFAFGLVFGSVRWVQFASVGLPAPNGTVMLAALTWLSGLQLMLAFIAHDFAATPTRPVSRRL